MSGYFIAWGKRLDLPTSAKNVLLTLCWLADANGTAYATNAFLMQDTGLSQRTITRTLNTLKTKGIVTALARFNATHNGLATKYQINWKPPKNRGNKNPAARSGRIDITPALAHRALKARNGAPWVISGQGILDEFKALLNQINTSGLDAHLEDQLVNLITTWVETQSKLSTQKAEMIVSTWEIVTKNLEKLTNTANPLSYLTTCLKHEIRKQNQTEANSYSLDEISGQIGEKIYQSLPALVKYHDETAITYDDLNRITERFINNLTSWGINEVLAWPITRRALEIIATRARNGWHHTLARTDTELASYGLTPQAAGALINLIIGPRTTSRTEGEFKNATYYSGKISEQDLKDIQTIKNTLEKHQLQTCG